MTEAPYPGDVYDDDVDVKGDCLHAKQGKLPPNAVDESVTELSRGCPRLVSLPLVRDINLSVFNSYKDHRNFTMHVFPHSACVFSSDLALPQCLSVCMKMSVELGLTLYHLRFLPLLSLRAGRLFS